MATDPLAITDADVAAFCRGAEFELVREWPAYPPALEFYRRLAAKGGAVSDRHALAPLRRIIVAGLVEVLASRPAPPPVIEVEREPAAEDVPWRNFDPPRHKRED